jgi:uncharacterized protein DUF4390
MTASSMRCCRSFDLLGAFLAVWLTLATAFAAQAQGIEVRGAAFYMSEEAYVLEAEFDIALTHTLEEALNKGVPLYFLLEFELIRPRWYWFNDKIISTEQEYRLSYNALTRQYRIGVGPLHQNFATENDALNFMSRIRRREPIEPGVLRKDTTYVAALRLRLDTSQLPKPFQLTALGSREWTLSSDWYRWSVTP